VTDALSVCEESVNKGTAKLDTKRFLAKVLRVNPMPITCHRIKKCKALLAFIKKIVL